MTSLPTPRELVARFQTLDAGLPLNEWPSRVYVAAPYDQREQAKELARLLENAGYWITSRWLSSSHDDDVFKSAPEDQARQAAEDLADVRAADVLVAINTPHWFRNGTGGRHVEVGYALGLLIPVVVFGSPSNVFHYAPGVRVVRGMLNGVRWLEGFDDLLDALRSVTRGGSPSAVGHSVAPASTSVPVGGVPIGTGRSLTSPLALQANGSVRNIPTTSANAAHEMTPARPRHCERRDDTFPTSFCFLGAGHDGECLTVEVP